jgi:cytochrome c553
MLRSAVRFVFPSLFSFLFFATQSLGQNPVYETVQAASADPDFQLQGEYTGQQRALQVVALGDGEFDILLFSGGLPGAGWDRSPPRKLSGDADEVQQLLTDGEFRRIERQSPTLGSVPPAGAVVLFDGTQQSLEAHWEPGAKRTEEGLLLQGATSRDRFGSYTLHLEFQTPFMPSARGQGRGNSGLYHQGRYETQILDSFGLEGKMNETGGIYSIKDPDLNMCLPPLSWQTYDVDFTAAQFNEAGEKIADAIITVRLNGVTVQQDVKLTHATTAAPLGESPSDGPIYLQDHGNPVRFRNIWVKPRDLEQEGKRPRLPGFERFFAQADATDLALGGQLLVNELGCAACHTATASDSQRRQAPILDAVGSRIRPDHLVDFISQPHAVKPGTLMPDLLAGMSDGDRQQTAQAIASFLLTTGSTTDRPGDPRAVRRGDTAFHSIGCTACHAPQNGAQVSEATSVPLGDLDAKYTLDSLSNFLREPHTTRPSGRMPNFGLTPEQSSDIATYLLRDSVVGQGVLNMKAAFYEGSWDSLPDFESLTPYDQVDVYGLDILASQKTDNFAARFTSTILLPETARYRFHLGSDDGSQLFIDDQLVLDQDGVHPMSFKSTDIELTAGPHAIRVDYFEKGGEEVLELEIEGGGLTRTGIATIATLDPNATQIESLVETHFVANPNLIEQGRTLFSSMGCASCHQLKIDKQQLPATLVAKPLAALDLERGCLSIEPSLGIPNYDLSPVQRAAIQIRGKELQADAAPGTSEFDDATHVHLTLATMNCYACHSRGGAGGPELSRDAQFQTTMKEMGDEGRLPPPLNGVGDKLQKDYLHTILSQGANERPYMLVNMPGFGADNLPGLVDALVRLDEKSIPDFKPHAIDELATVEKIKSDGRTLVGDKGLSCVKCHVFGGQGAPGIQAIDLQRMTTRLREDWFHRYLMSPTTYRPGTRMPASFPDGKSVLPALYDGEPSLQIAAMWKYLADGAGAREPIGIQAELIELVPHSRPTIYRNFIAGLSPRALAVGYPEQGNLAWDANRFGLTLLWKGAFIDASKHWVGRGPGNQGPLGDEVLAFESFSPIAILSSPQAPWPTQATRELGYKFQGYRLDAEGRPTFRYRLGATTVEDTFIPEQTDGRFSGFTRQLKLTTNADQTEISKRLYFRVASGQEISAGNDNWYQVDGKVSVQIEAAPEFIDVAGKREIRLPIKFSNGTANITQRIRW